MENKSFWKDGLSIEESKVSVIVITYLIGFIVTSYLCMKLGNVDVMQNIFLANLAAIAGINVTSYFTKPNRPIEDEDSSKG